MTEVAVFVCSICNEPATDICVYCTKDACRNHRCERCRRCSDCCECDIPLTGPEREAAVAAVRPEPTGNGVQPEAQPEPEPEPQLAPPEASEEPDLSTPSAESIKDIFRPEDGETEVVWPPPLNPGRNEPE